MFVVEDEPTVQFFYKQILTLYGFELAGIANDGAEAVSMFKSFSKKPKVILMDYRLPRQNGIDASKEILKIDKTVKIIMITGDNSIKEEACSIGVEDVLDKPLTLEKLIKRIQVIYN